MRVLMKDSLQERVLEKHQVYVNSWDTQAKERLKRFEESKKPSSSSTSYLFSGKDQANRVRQITGGLSGTQ